MENAGFKSNRHSIFNLKYHLVVVTKYRKKCINQEILLDLKNIFTRLLEEQHCSLIEFNGETDHIHLLFEAVPQVQLSILVNTLKTVSSRLIRKRHGLYLKQFFFKPVFWSQSYCILTAGGTTIETIKKYIQNQGGSADSSPPKP